MLDAWWVAEPEVRASVEDLLREALLLQAEGTAAPAERAIVEAADVSPADITPEGQCCRQRTLRLPAA